MVVFKEKAKSKNLLPYKHHKISFMLSLGTILGLKCDSNVKGKFFFKICCMKKDCYRKCDQARFTRKIMY